MPLILHRLSLALRLVTLDQFAAFGLSESLFNAGR